MASPDLLRLRGGDPRPAIDRGFGSVRDWRAVASYHLWNVYETCPAALYLLLGKKSEAYDDVCEAICEAILHSLGYVCVVTECPALLGDEPLVEWVRTSNWNFSEVPRLH
ncbi:hypothetical protein GHK33_20235 [Sinorhizobium meliloti]|uniref:hypothetical protein n=1 Tax=Rhizobium meliloti TaxID=382 RepID=UPI001295D32F|nr:hypothetical protein [Sinorhizobium meliloti]MQW64880.1 hypothetical protein [Sinorhizobium meliloti]